MLSMINQNWVFGQRARLDFSTSSTSSPPTASVLPNTFPFSTFEGCASISDANGNLLFYTDGQQVWDGTHVVKLTGLQGNTSSTQSAIIVPDPANRVSGPPNSQYYIFTADGGSGTDKPFNGVRINISTSTWTSEPLSSLLTLPSNVGFSSTERVTAIQHANCVDYWVITIVQDDTSGTDTVPGKEANALGTFRVFLVNSVGVTYISPTPMGVRIGDVGYLKASPNGLRIATANAQNKNVLVYDFNNRLGVISGLTTITVPPIPVTPPADPHIRVPYGVEFSPNSDVLYYSVLGQQGTGSDSDGCIFQVNLTTLAQAQIVRYPNPVTPRQGYALCALQLGSDGRIYIAKDGEGSVGAILSPNVLGLGCNLNINYITLPADAVCFLGLPNLLPNPCDCPCDAETGCTAEVNRANNTLDRRAANKTFTIVANGQTIPASCNLAFTNTAFDPVFTLHWGDGSSDHFESRDFEVIYFRIHNPFRNLIYRGVKIFNIRISPNQVLPNTTDALSIVPAEIACFDEIQPCSHVSRDFAFSIENAVVGPYTISFDYCIDEIAIVAPTRDGSAAFNINVVAS